MHHEFCPDCGHVLSQSWTECQFCGDSEDLVYSDDKDFDPGLDDDMAFALTDDSGAENGLGL
jgi:hypothetical protein